MCSPEQLVAAVDDCGFDCRLQSVHNVDTDDADSDRLQVRLSGRDRAAAAQQQPQCGIHGTVGHTGEQDVLPAAADTSIGLCRAGQRGSSLVASSSFAISNHTWCSGGREA